MRDVVSTSCCSFCGKNQDEVRKLIAGPNAYICDECIELCNEIIAEEKEKEKMGRSRSDVPSPREVEDSLDESRVGQYQEKQGDSVQPTADDIGERDQQNQSFKSNMSHNGLHDSLAAKCVQFVLEPFHFSRTSSLTEALQSTALSCVLAGAITQRWFFRGLIAVPVYVIVFHILYRARILALQDGLDTGAFRFLTSLGCSWLLAGSVTNTSLYFWVLFLASLISFFGIGIVETDKQERVSTEKESGQPISQDTPVEDGTPKARYEHKHRLSILIGGLLAYFAANAITDTWLLWGPLFLILTFVISVIHVVLRMLWTKFIEGIASGLQISWDSPKEPHGYLISAFLACILAGYLAKTWQSFLPLTILLLIVFYYLYNFLDRLRESGIYRSITVFTRFYSFLAMTIFSSVVICYYIDFEHSHWPTKVILQDVAAVVFIVPVSFVLSAGIVLSLAIILEKFVPDSGNRVKIANIVATLLCFVGMGIFITLHWKPVALDSSENFYNIIYGCLTFRSSGASFWFGWLFLFMLIVFIGTVIVVAAVLIKYPHYRQDHHFVEQDPIRAKLNKRLFTWQLVVLLSFVWLGYMRLFPAHEFGWTYLTLFPFMAFWGSLLFGLTSIVLIREFLDILVPSRRISPRGRFTYYLDDVPTQITFIFIYGGGAAALLFQWLTSQDAPLLWDWLKVIYKTIVFW